MTLVSSLRSRSTVQDHARDVEPGDVATLIRREVFVEGVARAPVQLVARSSDSFSHRDLILSSVFGSVGFVGLVALVIMIIQYWMRHRDTSEDMIIERPSQIFQDRQDTPVYQNAPFQSAPISIAPPTIETPDRAYIPNHPYAVSYTRDSSNTSPPTPPAKITTRPQTQHPSLQSLAISHPYTQSVPPWKHERVPSADPSTIYESFMSHDSPIPSPPPIIEPMESTPVASTVGGALSHLHDSSRFDALLSAALSDEAPSSMSASSSAPLRPGKKQPRQ